MGLHFVFRRVLLLAVPVIVGIAFAVTIPTFAKASRHEVQKEIQTHQNAETQVSPGKRLNGTNSSRTSLAPDIPPVLFVSTTGDGSDPEAGFDTGLTSLQDAIGKILTVGGGEIWVAAGVYYPDEGALQTDNAPTSTFELTDTIKLYGGFDINDTLFSERDPKTNITVLSGDIDGNDIKDISGVVTHTDNISGTNSYHVVSAKGVTSTAVLDGFTITAGKADGAGLDMSGAGFLCDASGSYNICRPVIKHVIFSGNLADGIGGGMLNQGIGGSSIPLLSNVIFINNKAHRGGAIYNHANNGGTSSPELLNIVFSGNSAEYAGGGIYNFSFNGAVNSPILNNIEFSNNTADSSGGAIFNFSNFSGVTYLNLNNSVFSGNYALTGGALFSSNGSGTISSFVSNSIFWDNEDFSGIGTLSANIKNSNSTVTLTHSILQGSMPGGAWIGESFINGGGNLDTDPRFRTNIDHTDAQNTEWDLRLQLGSPAINSGKNDFVSASTDLDGKARIYAGVVDMGAYEVDGFYQMSVSITGDGTGTLTSSPGSINCGDACIEYFTENSSITLAANPDEGSTFTGWGGDCSGTSDCQVTMSQDRLVSAEFTLETGFEIYLPLEFR